MTDPTKPIKKPSVWTLPRNVWAVGFTSFFMDISSDMVLNLLPLFLANVLGLQTSLIGLIEGIAETTASILKMFSGWFSDRMGGRKWIAVSGYALSAFTKPFFIFSEYWMVIAAVRWTDRIGKGIRTAPRDALIADSTPREAHGMAFGVNRAMDKAGAVIGLLIAAGIIWLSQKNTLALTQNTFHTIVLFSLIPAFLSVLSLAFGARDVPVTTHRVPPKFSLRHMGKPFSAFMVIVSIFTLGNSSDGFLVLRAQNIGISVTGILLLLAVYNLVISLVAIPAGKRSDQVGRPRLIITGWLIYAAIYFGFALAQATWHIWVLYILYGVYYGLAFGTANAMVADLVPEHLRGTAFGTYHAVIGLLAFPSSLIAGILWQGVNGWAGLGPSAPFWFGGSMAFLAALLLAFWLPTVKRSGQGSEHHESRAGV